MRRLGLDWQTLQVTPMSVIRAALVGMAREQQAQRMHQLAALSNQAMARLKG